MAISFVGSSNVANGLAQGTSAVLPRPPGVANGDFLLAFVSIGNVGAITPPAGWTALALGTFTAPNLQCQVYFKIAAGEPVSWTWTFPNTSYVAIGHATRGVSHVFAAAQGDDGLSLLSHTTPVIAAPANAWLVSSWTGRNLLALGWAPPAGDVERQDVVGGLLILLNVSHAVDDTNAAVAAGNYSKTTATLVAVRALDALVSLAPLLDPMVATPVDLKGLLAAPTMGLGLVADPIDLKAIVAAPTLGPPGLVAPAVTFLVEHGAPELIPGEVTLGPAEPVATFDALGEAALTPGELVVLVMPFTEREGFGDGEAVPGEVALTAEPVFAYDQVTTDGVIVLGMLLSDMPPIDGMAVFGGATLGMGIGSIIQPFIVVQSNFGVLPGGQIFLAGSAPVCCPGA